MRGVQCVGQLRDDPGNLAHRQLTARNPSGESLALIVRHRDERADRVVAVFVHRGDVGMIERTRRASRSSRAAASGSWTVPREKLERDLPVEVGILSKYSPLRRADMADDGWEAGIRTPITWSREPCTGIRVRSFRAVSVGVLTSRRFRPLRSVSVRSRAICLIVSHPLCGA